MNRPLRKTPQSVIGPKGEAYAITLEKIDPIETYQMERIGLAPHKYIIRIEGTYQHKTFVFMHENTGPALEFRYIKKEEAENSYNRLQLILSGRGIMEICRLV